MVNIAIMLNGINRYCIIYVALYTSIAIYYNLRISTGIYIPLNY